MKRERIGVIHGRFQPLHVGHLEYLLAGKSLCDKLVVGITNPDPWLTAEEETDPARGATDSNPFSFYERHAMVEGALVEAGVDRSAFCIVPFPHSFPERLHHYAPRDAVYFLSIYGEWGEEKLRRFASLGLATHVLWRRDSAVTSGTAIRALMRSNRSWEHLVPPAVARVLREQRAVQRVVSANTNGIQK